APDGPRIRRSTLHSPGASIGDRLVHQCQIRQNRPNRGLKIVLAYPEGEDGSLPEVTHFGTGGTVRMRVLIVHDDAEHAGMIAEALRQEGLIAHVAYGRDIEAPFTFTHDYDVIVLDRDTPA